MFGGVQRGGSKFSPDATEGGCFRKGTLGHDHAAMRKVDQVGEHGASSGAAQTVRDLGVERGGYA